MDQVQVNILHPKLQTWSGRQERSYDWTLSSAHVLETVLNRCFYVQAVCARVLGGDEEVRTRKATFSYSDTGLLFISIGLRSIWSHDEHSWPLRWR